jgi:hypothetical protein
MLGKMRRLASGEPGVAHIEFSRKVLSSSTSARKKSKSNCWRPESLLSLYLEQWKKAEGWVKGEVDHWFGPTPSSMIHRSVTRHALVSRLIILLIQVIIHIIKNTRAKYAYGTGSLKTAKKRRSF